jgi:hypothetical protein
MKVKVVLVSKPLLAKDAEDFKSHFEDLFDGKYIATGKYEIIGRKKYPLYYVGYIPVKNVAWMDGWIKYIDASKILSRLPKDGYRLD